VCGGLCCADPPYSSLSRHRPSALTRGSNVMNCRDFERVWNERLDARGALPPELERALESHATSCPSCRAIDARYQALCQAIHALGTRTVPPAGFVDRVLAAVDAGKVPTDDRPAVLRFAARFAPIATAAVLLVAFVLGLRAWT